MQISGHLNRVQLQHLESEIERMKLTPAQRRRLLYRLIKNGVVKVTDRNIKRQKSPDGNKFVKRQSKRRAKLLNKITKNIEIKTSPTEGKAYFKGKYKSTANKTIPIGVVAKTQQEGLSITQNKNQFNNQVHDHMKGSITKRQVKQLRKLGHTHSKNGKNIRSSVKWLKANLSEAQAGVVIAEMLDRPLKNEWTIRIPKREFLGINDDDYMKSVKRELRNIKYGGNNRGRN